MKRKLLWCLILGLLYFSVGLFFLGNGIYFYFLGEEALPPLAMAIGVLALAKTQELEYKLYKHKMEPRFDPPGEN